MFYDYLIHELDNDEWLGKLSSTFVIDCLIVRGDDVEGIWNDFLDSLFIRGKPSRIRGK